MLILNNIVRFSYERVLNIYKKKTNKKKVIAIVLMILLLSTVLIPVLSPMLSRQGTDHESMIPELSFNGSSNFEAYSQIMAKIDAVTGMTLKSGVLDQEVDIHNDESNPCVFVVSLYLGDGTKLFQTDSIMPGDSVSSITMLNPVMCGTYRDALLVYDCFTNDGNMTQLNRCEFVIQIKSV